MTLQIHNSRWLEAAQAVQTKSQTKTGGRLTPLIAPVVDFETEDLAKLQKEGKSLKKAMDAAKYKDNPQFQLQNGFLYRIKIVLTRKRNNSLYQINSDNV